MAAALPKEPRQQMINLMYLVLTALLALNVSSEIINAFLVIDSGISTSNKSLDEKLNYTLKAFEDKMAIDGETQVKPFFVKAKMADSLTKEMSSLIRNIKQTFREQATTNGEFRADDQEVTSRVMIEEKKGYELQKKLMEFRTKLLALIDEKDRIILEKQIPLNITAPGKEINPENKDWAVYNFYQMPAIGATTMLSQFENDAKSSASLIMQTLYSKISPEAPPPPPVEAPPPPDAIPEKEKIKQRAPVEFGAEDLKAMVIPNSTTVMDGEKFSAEIFVAAAKTANGGEPNITCNGQRVPTRDGVGTFTTVASGTGRKSYSGSIAVKNTKGVMQNFPFKGEYYVSKGAAVVSPDKMNVLYIGVDNPLSISVPGMSNEKIGASINGGGGTLKGGDGHYIARVTTTGEATVTVTSGSSTMGAQKFRVRRLPDPVPLLSNSTGGTMGNGEMKAQLGIRAMIDENFPFDVKYDVIGFTLVYTPKRGDIVDEVNVGARFTSGSAAMINQAKPGDSYAFDNIKVRGPDGISRKLPSIFFRIK